MKRKAATIVSVLLVIAGMLCVLYEPVVNFLYQNEQNQIIKEYNITVKNNTEATEINTIETLAAETSTAPPKKNVVIDYKRLRQDIKNYNKRIYLEGQNGIKGTFSYQTAPINLYNYGFQNTVYGYITIEKIGVKMSLYLGASESNMSMGAATLNYTSIPYGGKNTNSVIAGHCGYGGRNYFRYIENLSYGDKVEITTPFKKLVYKVYDKQIYDPKVFDEIKVQKGRDLITLFTCYPYPTSKKRICIFCEKI